MLLALDARNGSIGVGFRDEADWRARRVLGAIVGRSADEYALLLEAFLPPGGIVEGAILSSVVPSLAPVLVAAVRSAFDVPTTIVGAGTRSGLRIRSDLPQELGSDIVCDCVATKTLFPGSPCVVVDFGRSIVFSALNAAGDFLGAAIVPGLELAARVLHEDTALLPEVIARPPLRAIGTGTHAAIQSGLFHGYRGLVAGLAGKFREELATPDFPAASICIVATAAESEVPLLDGLEPLRIVPNLALEGLCAIAERTGLAGAGGAGLPAEA